MLTIDGVFLFQVLVASTLNELFTQKYLSLPLHKSALDKYYQLKWLKVCVHVVRAKGGVLNMGTVLDLLDFCMALFENFAPSRRRIYKNRQLRAQVFAYSVRRDSETGFSVKRFLRILHREPVHPESFELMALRREITALLEHVEFIKGQRGRGADQLVIQFDEWKKFRRLFAHVSTQYEFVRVRDNSRTVSVYVTVDEKNEQQLFYEVVSK